MFDSIRFGEALRFAAAVHAGDTRKETDTPYISHLLAVAALVIENGGSEDQAIAALLHDALEDHPEAVSVASLTDRFGADVAAIVSGCSDVVERDGDGRKPPWEDRKRDYLAHLETASADVLLVSLADKVHNARSILRDVRDAPDPAKFWTRFNSSKTQQFWYYGELANVFARRAPGALSAELTETVDAVRRTDAERDSAS